MTIIIPTTDLEKELARERLTQAIIDFGWEEGGVYATAAGDLAADGTMEVVIHDRNTNSGSVLDAFEAGPVTHTGHIALDRFEYEDGSAKLDIVLTLDEFDEQPGEPREFSAMAIPGVLDRYMSAADTTPPSFTTAQVAAELGVDESRVRQLAQSRGIGTKHGRDWAFTKADIEALRVKGTPGPKPRA